MQFGLDFTMFGFIFVDTNSKIVDLNTIFFAPFLIDFLANCVRSRNGKIRLNGQGSDEVIAN